MSRCVVHLNGQKMWVNGTEITNITQLHLNMDSSYAHTTIDLTIIPDEVVYGSPPNEEKDDSLAYIEPKPSQRPRGVRRAINEERSNASKDEATKHSHPSSIAGDEHDS